jgi:branched-chain amino acid transport system substrate-binding protein
MYFPVSASYYAGVYALVAAARDVGAKSMAYPYCAEAAACASGVPVAKAAAEREGLKFYAEQASNVAPDYTANCLRAKNANADYLHGVGLNLANLVRDCSRQNYHPTYGVGGAISRASIDAAQGNLVAGALFEFGTFYNGPEVQRFRKALATTDVQLDAVTQSSVHAWLGLEMAGAVLKRMTATNPTRQDVLNTLYTIKGENLDGQIAPVDYTVQRPGTGMHAGNDCWTEHIVKDGKLYHMDTHGQIATKLTFICGTGFTLNDKGSPM